MIPVSERFLSLLRHQLDQFADSSDLRSLVVYVAHQGPEGAPGLLPVGQWPADGRRLPSLQEDSALRLPDPQRRWLPLRQHQRLLGALQVEILGGDWSEPLRQRLQAVALCLTDALLLDLEQQRLAARLEQQEQQLRLLVHQLRNPLTALRTFAHLLQRRLGPQSDHRELVEGLLAEERQLNRYVEAISELAGSEGRLAPAGAPQPLLLPPSLSGPGGVGLAAAVAPLLQRAAATAALAARSWSAPQALPDWRGDSGAVAEILANLLENAFRYSAPQAPVGLVCQFAGQHGEGAGVAGQPQPVAREAGRSEIGVVESRGVNSLGVENGGLDNGGDEPHGDESRGVESFGVENPGLDKPGVVARDADTLAWQEGNQDGVCSPAVLRLIVWDGGPAIPAAERQAIFGRGQRGSSGVHLPGTGLGLALARDLARSLGGDLELVVPPSQCAPELPAEGNAFRLSLPLTPASVSGGGASVLP